MRHNTVALLLHLLLDIVLAVVGIVISHLSILYFFGGPDRFLIWFIIIFGILGLCCMGEDYLKYQEINEK